MSSPTPSHTGGSSVPSINHDQSEPPSRSISGTTVASGTVDTSERSSSSPRAEGSFLEDGQTSASFTDVSLSGPLLPSGQLSHRAGAQGSSILAGTSASLRAASSASERIVGATEPIDFVRTSESHGASCPTPLVSPTSVEGRQVVPSASAGAASPGALAGTSASGPLEAGGDVQTDSGSGPGLSITGSSTLADLRSMSVLQQSTP